MYSIQGHAGVRKSQTRLGPQIANPQSVTFAEGPQIKQIILVSKFADLRFSDLFADRPPLLNLKIPLDRNSCKRADAKHASQKAIQYASSHRG